MKSFESSAHERPSDEQITEFIAETLVDSALHIMDRQDREFSELYDIGQPLVVRIENPLTADKGRNYEMSIGPYVNRSDGDILPDAQYVLRCVDYEVTTLERLTPYERQGVHAMIAGASREEYFSDYVLLQLQDEQLDPDYRHAACRTELICEYRADEHVTGMIERIVYSNVYFDDVLAASTATIASANVNATDGFAAIELLKIGQQEEEIGVEDLAIMRDILFRFSLPGGKRYDREIRKI